MSDSNVLNVLNVEAKIIPFLHLKLYTIDSEKDVEITMGLDKVYRITHTTSDGLKTSEGVFTRINNMTVTRQPVKMIDNTYGSLGDTSIILDCSDKFKSELTTIYLKHIRNVEEIPTP